MKSITRIINIQVFIIFQLLALISYSSGNSLPKIPVLSYGNNLNLSSSVLSHNSKKNSSISNITIQAVTSNFVYMPIGNKAPIWMCVLDESGDQFNNCHNVSWTFDYPTSVTIHPLHKYIYTVNSQSGLVSACPLNLTTGDFSICNVSWYDFKSPSSLAFSPDGKQAYITDYMKNGSVWLCLVSESTMLPANCKATGSGFDSPSSIIIDPTGNYAYISDYNNNSVVRCSVTKPSGLLNNCTVYYDNLLKPRSFTFIDNASLYIANQTNVAYAIIDNSGNLTFFNNYYGFNNLVGLASYTNDLYIADGGTGVVSECKYKDNQGINYCQIIANKSGISGIAILSN